MNGLGNVSGEYALRLVEDQCRLVKATEALMREMNDEGVTHSPALTLCREALRVIERRIK
jgi:hypothetical protein